MAISIKKYVDITSGVGGSAAVKERELILRIFTTSSLVPAGNVMEFTELNDVATTFGTDSEEYKRAAMYFGFISKAVTKAKKIAFAHYSADSLPVAPNLQGGTPLTVIATWKAITDGALSVSVGGTNFTLTGIDFSSASALADVASTLQTKLRTVSGLSNATVEFNITSQKFNATFTGVTPPANVTIGDASAGTDIKDDLGWTVAKGMVTSSGSAAVTPLQFVIEADEISDNYGSFVFAGEPLEHDVVQSIAEWNAAQNVKYQYLVPVTRADADAWYGTLQTYSGTALTIVADPNVEFDEQIPGVILGATDYRLRAASQNYMYQQVAGITPKINTTTDANIIDGLRVNYYGQTKQAGQPINFYQNGYLCGVNTSPLQMNVYANEQWFKSAATTLLLSTLLALPIIPATDEGRTIVLSAMQDVIDRALYNGTIVVGKELNVTQKSYILQITFDPLAWVQIQSIGYWIDAVVQEEAQANGTTRYIIDYTLLYSKGDAVNKITGRDILI